MGPPRPDQHLRRCEQWAIIAGAVPGLEVPLTNRGMPEQERKRRTIHLFDGRIVDEAQGTRCTS